LPITVT